MNLDKEEIKELLSNKARDALYEIGLLKKVVRNGKIKKIHRAKNDAQKQKLTGQTKQQRRQSTRLSIRGKRKAGSLHHKKKQELKTKRSLRKGRNIAGRGSAGGGTMG